MKNLSQAQALLAAVVFIIVVGLVATLAEGLKKYENETYAAEQAMANQPKPVPSDPDTISEELKNEDTLTETELQTEMDAETKELKAEDSYLDEVTKSYE